MSQSDPPPSPVACLNPPHAARSVLVMDDSISNPSLPAWESVSSHFLPDQRRHIQIARLLSRPCCGFPSSSVGKNSSVQIKTVPCCFAFFSTRLRIYLGLSAISTLLIHQDHRESCHLSLLRPLQQDHAYINVGFQINTVISRSSFIPAMPYHPPPFFPASAFSICVIVIFRMGRKCPQTADV